jgi:hypothetical protein
LKVSELDVLIRNVAKTKINYTNNIDKIMIALPYNTAKIKRY